MNPTTWPHCTQRSAGAFLRRWALVGIGIALSAAACGNGAPPPEVPAPQPQPTVQGEPVRKFSFVALDGTLVHSAQLRGRMALVVLAASFDDASQAQARFLGDVLRSHVPRANGLLVVLEPEHHRPLVEVFAEVVDVPCPVVWAGDDTIAGKGPFPALHSVPSTVLLDRDGREVWRHLGICDDRCLEEALQAHENR